MVLSCSGRNGRLIRLCCEWMISYDVTLVMTNLWAFGHWVAQSLKACQLLLIKIQHKTQLKQHVTFTELWDQKSSKRRQGIMNKTLLQEYN